MYDKQLQRDAMNRAGGAHIHRVCHHLTAYVGYFELANTAIVDPVKVVECENISKHHERILRSFLVTGDIYESEKLIRESSL